MPIADFDIHTVLADALTNGGIAVLRYDDRGVGESEGDLASATLEDLATDASAAADYLMTREEIDPARVGLIGHSEGGILVAQAALNNDDIAFLISLAGPAVSMADILAEQNYIFTLASGATEEEATAVRDQFGIIREAYANDDEDAIRAAVAELIELQTGGITDEVLQQAGVESREDFIDQGVAQFDSVNIIGYFTYDVESTWAQVDIPVLGIYGGNDTQVPAEQNVPCAGSRPG